MNIHDLSPENWQDVREAVHVRLKEVSEEKVTDKAAKKEQARHVNSLKESLNAIQRIVEEVNLFKDDLPFGNSID